MASKNDFSKKIQELTRAEIEYTEDFFKKTFSKDGDVHISAMKRTASHNPAALTSSLGVVEDRVNDAHWLDQKEEQTYDGQLSVDVLQTDEEIIITSTVAGLKAEDLDISINGDMITIKGVRSPRFQNLTDEDYFIRECYWGGFSRSIILPVDVQHDKIQAELDHGILVVRLPKAQHSRNGKIDVVDISERVEGAGEEVEVTE